jgi:hypothetical protein
VAIPEFLMKAVEVKAKRILNNKKWVTYAQDLSKELGYKDSRAFIAVAIDAMIFDVAAMLHTRRITSREERKELILHILKSHGL